MILLLAVLALQQPGVTAAHAHGTAGIKAAVRAGVTSIEHGSILDAEAVALMKQHGTWLVPTLLAGFTVESLATQDACRPRSRPRRSRSRRGSTPPSRWHSTAA